MTTKNHSELYAELATFVSEAETALKKASDFADQHGLIFTFNDLTYYPNRNIPDLKYSSPYYFFEEDDQERYDEYYRGNWMSSTDECNAY